MIVLIGKLWFKMTKNINEKILSKIRYKKLKNKDFTIISNNCFSGGVYRRYNLPYNTPTVGLFIMPKDYIKFLSDLKNYIETDLEFISPENSKYKEYISNKDSRFGKYPIGKLKDVEIHFLHYKTEEEAYEKWNRRKNRINYKKCIVKFNDQNNCSKKNIEDFINLKQYKNKICFVANKDFVIDKNENIIYEKEFKKFKYVVDDSWFLSKYLNMTKFLNDIIEE